MCSFASDYISLNGKPPSSGFAKERHCSFSDSCHDAVQIGEILFMATGHTRRVNQKKERNGEVEETYTVTKGLMKTTNRICLKISSKKLFWSSLLKEVG